MLQDYYKILEIPRTSSIEEIKRAYRIKAKALHPDINHSPKANEVFSLVNEAYDVLTDERKRYLHDIKLNYADAQKIASERKKQYYGTSVKNDWKTNTNQSNFDFGWNNYKTSPFKEKTDIDYFKQSPFIYNLFFASGMFVGFIIILVTTIGTFKNYWPQLFILVTIPGIILVREGWRGMIGKRTLAMTLFKYIKNKRPKH